MTVADHAQDTAAVDRLEASFAAQKTAFLKDPYPSAEARKRNVQAVADMLVANRMRIREAMSEDFAVHPELFADMVEVLGMCARAQWAIDHIDEWMEPEAREADPALYGTGRAFVRWEPKGVIGNMVPWNFPYDLSMGPLIDSLAAGNRVIIKPSEHTPAASALMQDMVSDTFDRDLVDVAVGGVDLARAFTHLRWDHLLYTGNPRIAREVAKAAAENLVPVTLELGGKCPAIIAPDGVTERTVRNILGTKMIKNGQMCTSIDHCLVPREQVSEFVDLAKRHMADVMPNYSASDNCPGIINHQQYGRLEALLAEARDAGVEIVQLDDQGLFNPRTRQMPLSILVEPGDELGVMQEEIFGPLLPVRGYETLDEAIDYVNAHERPLALYVMTDDPELADDTLRRTSSGGAAVNACAMQGAIPGLGFGGVGESGIGRHHGVDGFREFSNPRGIFIRGAGDSIDAFYAPYDADTEKMVEGAFAAR